MKDKLRIGFFSWETRNSIPVGGVAAVVTHLGEALADLGHEMHIFTRIDGMRPEHEQINGVWEHRCISPGCEDFIEYLDHMCDSMVSQYHVVKNHVGEFDLIHGHDWHVVNALSNIKHNTGFDKLVWSLHSTEYGRNGNNHADNWFSNRVKHREWLGGYMAKEVTTVSHTMKNEMQWLYQTPGDKISVIYNGTDINEFLPNIDAGKIKERYGLWALDPLIVFLGRVGYQKGPDLLAEAIPQILQQNPNAKFIYAGTGDMLDYVWGRLCAHGVQDSCRMLGYVSDQERRELLSAADIVSVPSRNEPFGIITLEAWASGTPVVACDTGGPGEIIENFKTGVKTHQTPESIAWGINYLLGDKSGESIKKMGKVCLEHVKNYDWHELAKQYVKVYEKL